MVPGCNRLTNVGAVFAHIREKYKIICFYIGFEGYVLLISLFSTCFKNICSGKNLAEISSEIQFNINCLKLFYKSV